MKVQLVINGTDFGGTESALSHIARSLARRGHLVHVLSLKPVGRIGRRLQQEGIAVGSLSMSDAVNLRGLGAATLKLAAWLRRQRPDVVHSFLPRANVISRLANRIAGIGSAHFSSERSTDFKRSHAVMRLNRYTARWTHQILAVSPAVAEVLVNRDRVPLEKIVLLNNGIDVEALDAAARTSIRRLLGIEQAQVVFCAAGRLVRDKGYVYLIRALARMRRRDASIHLLLIGEGPEEDAIRQEVLQHGLRSQVHLLGFRRDVVGILKDVDGYVLSSLEEGVPVVVLEAMACMLPVIATTVGGVPGLVIDGETGILVPPAEVWDGAGGAARDNDLSAAGEDRSVAALAEAMDRLAADPELRRLLGHRGRRRVETEFHLDRITTRLEQLYTGASRTAMREASDLDRPPSRPRPPSAP